MKKIFSAALALACIWFATPAHAALPSGYTELSYIESTGTQYIDTGITLGGGTNYKNTDIKLEYDAVINQGTIWQVSGTVGGEGIFVGVDGSNNISYGGGNQIVTGVTNPYVRCLWTNDAPNGRVTVKNTITGINIVDVTYTPVEKTSSINIFLFNYPMASGSVSHNYMSGKMYGAKIYNNGTIIRNFVPAKNASGVVGMYDTVNNRFYTNAGTGEFVAGDPVTTCNGTIVNYTSATGTVSQSGTPTPDNPIEPVFYQQGNMVLRKVGNYADSYDATTGKITRRVGVKVLDGTEDWRSSGSYTGSCYLASITNSASDKLIYNTHFIGHAGTSGYSVGMSIINNNALSVWRSADTTPTTLKQYLAQQYAAGTPVTVYYPLETETTEDWPAEQCATPIKIATTKYNETAFSPLNAALQNAISVVDTVVSNTITQAGRIATLQAQKQTRPNDIADDNEKCPAGKKCLLVEDVSGIPHWYEIVERYSILPDGYTELEYLTSGTDGQYIDTGILFDPTKNFRVVGNFINPYATLRKVILGNYYSQQSETYYSIELYSDGKFRNYMSADGGSAFNIYSPTAVPADTIAYFDTSYNALTHQTTTTLRYGTTEQTYSGATPETTTVAVHTLKLFNDKRNLSPVYNYPVSIGAVQIYIDDILAHHYVPARRESDGVLGMYDLADPNPATAFYTNAGTGEFTAGDPVVE